MAIEKGNVCSRPANEKPIDGNEQQHIEDVAQDGADPRSSDDLSRLNDHRGRVGSSRNSRQQRSLIGHCLDFDVRSRVEIPNKYLRLEQGWLKPAPHKALSLTDGLCDVVAVSVAVCLHDNRVAFLQPVGGRVPAAPSTH